MPMIRIEFDNTKVDNDSIKTLSVGMQKIVQQCTNIEDVFVYANNSQIKISVAPIEVFIEMSAHKILDSDSLFEQIKSKISERKTNSKFQFPINLTLIPMNRKFDVNI